MVSSAGGAPYRFDAFISYSRHDEGFAKRLEAALEHYRIPRGVMRDDGAPVPRSRLNIFRDTYDLGGTQLAQELDEQIRSSRCLIVVCSPAARRDENGWIRNEIERFAAHAGDAIEDRIIPVLARGRPNQEVKPGDALQDQAFPDVLYEYLDEPLAADFRRLPNTGLLQHRERQREALIHVLANLLDTSKGELARRHQQRMRRMYIAVVTSLTLIAVALAGLSVFAFNQKRLAEEQRNLAELRLADLCRSLEEAAVLADSSNHGSVYYFQGEEYERRDECKGVEYQAWRRPGM
jgi:hypothetical protein